MKAVACVCGGGGGSVYLAVMSSKITSLPGILNAPSNEVRAGHFLSNNDLGCSRAVSLSNVNAVSNLYYASTLTVVGSSIFAVLPQTSVILTRGRSNDESRPLNYNSWLDGCSASETQAYQCGYVYVDTNVESDGTDDSDRKISRSEINFGIMPYDCFSCLAGSVSVDYFSIGGMGKVVGPTGEFTEKFNISSKQFSTAAGSDFVF